MSRKRKVMVDDTTLHASIPAEVSVDHLTRRNGERLPVTPPIVFRRLDHEEGAPWYPYAGLLGVASSGDIVCGYNIRHPEDVVEQLARSLGHCFEKAEHHSYAPGSPLARFCERLHFQEPNRS
jgi:hypothetical protein